jgi:hypothetical protein
MRKLPAFSAPLFFHVKFKGVFFSFALMALVSCAPVVTYEKAMDSLSSSAICCTSIAQFRYDQLVEGEDVSFKLDESSAAFPFKTGKSYFKLFRLPDRELPYSIRIRSFDVDNTVNDILVFYPQIALLDDRFVMVRQSSPAVFSLSIVGFSELVSAGSSWRFKLEGYVPIDSPNEKYVLVFTTEQLMRGAIPYRRPITVPAVIPMGFETAVIRHPPFAHLHMKIVPFSVENVIAFDLQTQLHAARSLVEDGVIEPGVRIGRLRLGGKLHEVTKLISKGVERGPETLYQNSTAYTWEAIGLWLIADHVTGDILWMSVSTGPASPWSEVSTHEGLRLGSTEQEVLSAMGVPSRTIADAYGKSIFYEDKGIIFILPTTGRFAQKVDTICIFRP